MSRQRTWFWIFAAAEVSLVLLLGATALAWRNGVALLERYQAGDSTVTMEQLNGIDSIVQLLAILTIVALVVRLVTLVGWLHSCVRLVADEHLGHLTHSPGWAIGAWFVPFLNLVRVPRIFMDVQAAGESESRFLKASSTIVVWWVAFLGIAVLDRVLSAPSRGEGIGYIRQLSTEATQSTLLQLAEAALTVPLLLALTTALGRHLASARVERARVAAFPAPAVALDPYAYAAHPYDPAAPDGAPAPYAPVAAPYPPPPSASQPPPTWVPPSEPGSSAPLPGFAAPPSYVAARPNVYEPVLPAPPHPGAAGAPAPVVVPPTSAEPQERVRILSDHEKADLAAVSPSSTDAGWYDDPLHVGGRRFWNGEQWTGRAVTPSGG